MPGVVRLRQRQWPLLLWLLAGLVIALQIAPRLGDGSWQNRTGGGGTVLMNGVRVHWEWIDVSQSALLAEGDKRWQYSRGEMATCFYAECVAVSPRTGCLVADALDAGFVAGSGGGHLALLAHCRRGHVRLMSSAHSGP